ncbi:DUF6094 domain-containing protein [Alicyclobacillus shizuokensis]|uniref:DUF6094 domain-containing protein n=1 Tax=Alicyclobacillus shizuokensis TaxID=392014 RepID=UPI000833767B|nr:DUF6094 domain-containing protein [Alicyclobacillus shizuokensis]
MYARWMNEPLSKFTCQVIRTYLKFPEGQAVTALDYRCGDGEVLYEITRMHPETYRYGVTENQWQANRARERFTKVCTSSYKNESKVTPEAFSLVVMNPDVDSRLIDEIFRDYDPFTIPDFEAEVRRLLEAQEAQDEDVIDFGDEGLTEEEIQKRREKFEAKVRKTIEEREIAFRRMQREQERRMVTYRWDKFLLNLVSDKLAPNGILIFVTPKEFIDSQICFKLANQYDDIRVYRQDDAEYEEQRKCIIFARKRPKAIRDPEYAYELMQYKYRPYKEIPVISIQAQPLYQVPSKRQEDVLHFRVGPVTAEEALSFIRRSSLVSSYQQTYSQVLDNEVPKPPTQLHKGHVALMLASGYLNGYIGTGPDQHLVKGSVVKMSQETTEEDEEGVTRIKEREYYHIGVKFLDRHGQFHKLM